MGLLNKFRKAGKRKNYREEILDNLECLLNTKQTFGAWQKGLGLSSYCNGKSRTDLIEDMIEEIKLNIEKFEPRIKLTEVDFVKDSDLLNMKFKVDCQSGGSFHSFYIGFKQLEERVEIKVGD